MHANEDADATRSLEVLKNVFGNTQLAIFPLVASIWLSSLAVPYMQGSKLSRAGNRQQ